MTDKQIKEKELQINSILEMRFGDGTGQDLQVKLATKEILALLSSVREETIREVLVDLDELEMTDLNKSGEQWKNYKRIRNYIVDKNSLQPIKK